jgi:hypothetical protein
MAEHHDLDAKGDVVLVLRDSDGNEKGEVSAARIST